MESGDEDELSIGKRDFDKMQSHLTKGGYREGIAAGKEKHLQQYFDASRKFIAEWAWKFGSLLGSVMAAIDFKTIPLTSAIEELIGDIKLAIKIIETSGKELLPNCTFEETLNKREQEWENTYVELKSRFGKYTNQLVD